jgi:FAD/FMN-containing dehydrogenase
VVDATRLTRVVEVNVADRYITVEAGCTWAARLRSRAYPKLSASIARSRTIGIVQQAFG